MIEGKQTLIDLSLQVGGGKNPYLLTRQDSSSKLSLNFQATDQFEQVICHLLPHALGKKYWAEIVGEPAPWIWRNVCPYSTPGCRSVCLAHSGRLNMGPAKRAMLARTALYCKDQGQFWQLIDHEIGVHNRRVRRSCKTLVVRLDGTSQINIEEQAPWILDKHSNVIFQDYLKGPYKTGWTRPNRYVVSSATERDTADSIVGRGNVVFPVNVPKGEPLPDMFMGRPVIDGDKHDLRLMDQQGENAVLVRVKGHRRENYGFIREVVR